MYCYNMITRDRSSFIESKEGYTYVTYQIQERVSLIVLNFLPPSDTSKWGVKVRRTSKKLKTNDLQEEETEYCDVD